MVGVDFFDVVLTTILQVKRNETTIDPTGHYWIGDEETGCTARVFGDGSWCVTLGYKGKRPLDEPDDIDEYVGAVSASRRTPSHC